jgi:hypothetical protein
LLANTSGEPSTTSTSSSSWAIHRTYATSSGGAGGDDFSGRT